MTVAAAMQEMLTHLDAKLPELPVPRVNAGGDALPPDLVALITLEEQLQGVGRISNTTDGPTRDLRSGALAATVNICLWAHFADDVVLRARQLFALLLRLDGEETAHGRFIKARLESDKGAEYVSPLSAWRINVGLDTEFEYGWETVPGTGVISQIPVRLTGELEEVFTVEND